MLKEFYLSFKNPDLDFRKIKHIQYNLIKRLNKLRYITHRRIDLFLTIDTDTTKHRVEFEWDDGKTARIVCSLSDKVLNDPVSRENVIEIYKGVLSCFQELWEKNGWIANDLIEIYNEITKESFSVTVIYGKNYLSPDKKHKVEFICDIFPEYADYYLQFSEKKNIRKQKIKFLKGIPLIELFFGFYNNAFWRDNEYFFLTDANKEIYFIFNVKKDDYIIEYKPMYNSLDQCKNHVRAFEADVSIQERRKLLGLPA